MTESGRDLDSTQALRSALESSAARAAAILGELDGFWKNPDVRVPLPPRIEAAERLSALLLRVEAFRTFQKTLNRAAERAMPRVALVLARSIARISIADAIRIVRGSQDAATQYFRRVAWLDLVREVRPIVAEATDEVGVTRSYKQLETTMSPVTRFLDPDAMDLDGFVTIHALEGLFIVMAREEAKIRANPVGRIKELLKRSFKRAGKSSPD